MAHLDFCDICGGRIITFHGMKVYELSKDGRRVISEEKLDICKPCFNKEYERIKELKKDAVIRALERLGD